MKKRNLLHKTTLLLISLLLFSCAKGRLDPFDTKVGLTRSEFSDVITKYPQKKNKNKNKLSEEEKNAPIPEESKLRLLPPKNNITSKIISFSVTDQVPLKDVLIELGRVAKIDIDLDPNISGGIVVNARNRPLNEVIDRIATIGNLRYSYINGVLHFERDSPYTKNYIVDYLTDGSTLWDDVQININSILNNVNVLATNATNNTDSKDKSDTTTQQLAKSTITINKSAGILSAFATKKQHTEIEKYLHEVQKNSSSQVLIEAKVVEVGLKEAFKTGIDWSRLGSPQYKVQSSNSFADSSPISFVATEIGSSGLTASISALESFGTTRTLSSPRIHAANNKKAILNFVDKLIYFQVTQTQTNALGGGATGSTAIASTISSTKQEENVGVQLEITPSINLSTNEVTMNIKPKLSVHSSDVIDPASPKDLKDSENKQILNKVPVIQTREINTVAKIKSGGIFVIGGLMKEVSSNSDSGVPFIQRIPILGYLFKSSSKSSEVTETVIFIKATILNSDSQVNKVDREMQEKFDSNRRIFF